MGAAPFIWRHHALTASGDLKFADSRQGQEASINLGELTWSHSSGAIGTISIPLNCVAPFFASKAI